MYFVCLCVGLLFILLFGKGLSENFCFYWYMLFPSKLVWFWEPTFRDNSIEFVPFLIFHHRYTPLQCPSVPLSLFFLNIGFFNFGKFLFDYAGGIIPLRSYFGITITNFLFQLFFTFNLHSRIK